VRVVDEHLVDLERRVHGERAVTSEVAMQLRTIIIRAVSLSRARSRASRAANAAIT
jgi:hypothetical protein